MRLLTLRRIFGATLASTALALTFIPGIASAHAILESSSPAPSALLASSPKEIRLDFDEQVESTLGDIRIYDSEQREISIEKTVRSSTDASVVSAEVPALKSGVYVVVWRVVSADGHPVSGAFPFEIGTNSSPFGCSPTPHYHLSSYHPSSSFRSYYHPHLSFSIPFYFWTTIPSH